VRPISSSRALKARRKIATRVGAAAAPRCSAIAGHKGPRLDYNEASQKLVSRVHYNIAMGAAFGRVPTVQRLGYDCNQAFRPR
jgi:hypothetical protein